MKKMRLFHILLTILLPLSLQAQSLPDISFGPGSGWTFTGPGISYDPVTEELTIVGDPTKYQFARLTVNIPDGTPSLYLVADTWAAHIKAGQYNWHKGKLKINTIAGSAKNLPEGSEGFWTIESSGGATSKTQHQLEFAMQNCEGTLKIKAPRLSIERPEPTPYSFPYTVPSNPQCDIDLISTDKRAFNNDLLSFNNHFIFTPSVTWESPEVIDAINEHYPMTNYRFPGGTVGNHYNWQTDLVHNDAGSQAQMNYLIALNRHYGYPGFKNQMLTTGETATLMFNVNSDDKTDATARLQSRLADGINIKWIELGNETYYPHQSHGSASGGQFRVADVNEYIDYTKDLTETVLNVLSPSTGIAVPIDHDRYDAGSWSDVLSRENYFDATIMHLYVGTGEETLSYTGGLNLMNAYKRTRTTIDKYKEHYGSTPTLLTEWLSMGPAGILTVLSNADVFMGLLEGDVQDGVVKQTGMHMLYHSDGDPVGGVIGMHNGNMRHGSLGVLQAKMFEVFKGHDIYTALSASDELASDLPGIISKAFDYGDSIKVFSINKYPVEAELNISYDGIVLNSNYRMETYSNLDPMATPVTYLDPSDAWVHTSGTGSKMLPAYSLTVTTLPKSNEVTATFANEAEIQLSVHPSPTDDVVFVEGIEMHEEYQVLNTNGRLCKSGNYDSNGISLSDLPSGVYVLKVGYNLAKVIKN